MKGHIEVMGKNLNFESSIGENQIFIRVKKGNNFINKDITDSKYSERIDWYNSLSKGQIVNVLEKIGNFNKNVK